MNRKLHSWFDQGKIPEALCGFGGYFIPDATYSDDHSMILAVGELLNWADHRHPEQAAIGFEEAVTNLMQRNFRRALLLLRSYNILSETKSVHLPFDKQKLENDIRSGVNGNAIKLSEDGQLRHLLLLVLEQYPGLEKEFFL